MTAQQLLDYATSLTQSAQVLNDRANDPNLSFADAKIGHDKAWAISQQAWKINSLAIAALEDGVATAVSNLTQANDKANAFIKAAGDFQTALSVGAALLSVAAAIASGNPLGAVASVNSLITTINSAMTANGN